MPTGNKKLAVVTASLDIGGAETQIAGLLPLLVQRGWDVSVLSMLKRATVAGPLREAGVPVVHLGLDKRGLRLSTIFALGRMAVNLSQELRRISPDVVHSHMIPANILTRLVRPSTRVPVLVCTAHSIIEPPAWRNLMYRITDRFCDLTTNICSAGVDHSISDGRVPAGRIVHMPNGVDTARFRHDPRSRVRLRDELGLGDQFVWLAVGRLTWEKDWPTMLRAFEATAGGSLLLAAGDGALLDEMRDAAAATGLERRVRFLGSRPDVHSLMSAADGYVMSSTVEGLPMVLLEASSCGLPIVATKVGGVSEIVEHGVTGFLVAPGQPDELASALQRVEILPEKERQAMGAKGRMRTLENYEIRLVVDRWDLLYRQLLARNGSRHFGADSSRSR